ncbi:CHASE2 domain-containing protein [Winogradskyella sp. DF17]|uniref:CHASE2 domain-containing protein n=1 Tax=Winogradskyella pelagia TaxID=2819984 RepID=A0ABS3T240_9FLAO|nr:CHASE2 domain-containing protein [Winogradskyella sp. DF17]MBO3116810.1 CHASE2 domain-containing protein [Winogradskyella sp. DF17]
MKRKTKLLIRDAFFSSILTSVIIGILYLAIFNVRFFNPIHKVFEDFSFLDVYFAQQFEESTKVNEEIILINIENHDREIIASLLETVLSAKPKAVGFDVILEPHDEHFAADSLLAQLLEHKKVVTAFEVKNERIIQNEAFFSSRKRPNFTNFNFDEDVAVVRDFIGFAEIQSEIRTSFATQIAKTYLSDKKWTKYSYDEKLETPQVINFSGNTEKFPVLTLEDLSFENPSAFLKNKVVILGYVGRKGIDSRADITDKFWTPLNERLFGKSDRDMYGPVVHANIVNMLIKNKVIQRVSHFWLVIITFICMYFSTMVYMKLNKYYKISYRTRKQTFQFIFSVTLLIIVYWLLTKNIVLNPILILVGVILSGSYFKYYKHLTRYIKTKRKWKTYLK